MSRASCADGVSALDLVGVLHPTAAVAGTPTTAALEVIRASSRSTADATPDPSAGSTRAGDGEWAIALRCAQFGRADRGRHDPASRAYAGAGIVVGSDPEAELLETRMKFRPIVDALA